MTEQQEWKQGWPRDPGWYLCRKADGTTLRLYHRVCPVCRRDQQSSWLDQNHHRVEGEIEWKQPEKVPEW